MGADPESARFCKVPWHIDEMPLTLAPFCASIFEPNLQKEKGKVITSDTVALKKVYLPESAYNYERKEAKNM